ncbi:transposase [Stieleria marina]|uniref:Transposase IS116/IS110/IS902 family protein n=1 Tax=Stieleria marina TaxID=1930275 RepID=A0A517NM69_9BACT|nr:Transposase IS116/IS110/IS902 family protein [Planctomycetes bacterium K23_9]
MMILAMDLGKFNTVCCLYDTVNRKYSFETIATKRSHVEHVLQTHRADLIVMEACGPSGWISDVCRAQGIKTIVCSTNDEAWSWKNTKRKTDRKTAEALVATIDNPHRFKSARHLSSYLGMTPKQYQSGETDRSGRISKRGPRMLRSMLLECAWASTRYNA